MQELVFLLIPFGALFWRLGGWFWKGFKVYIFPVVVFVIISFYDLTLFQLYGVPLTFGLIAALPRGKGERLRINLLVSLSYCLPALFFLPYNIYDLIPAVVFISTLLLSYHSGLQWAIAEILTGGAIGLTTALKIFYLTNLK